MADQTYTEENSESMATRMNGPAEPAAPGTAIPPSLDPARAAKLAEEIDLAEALLLPNPGALYTAGEQVSIPIVTRTTPLEFFRAHPTIRMTLKMLTPNKGGLGAPTYAVMPAAEGLLARYKFEPFLATLYPIVIASTPLSYKLMTVKHPPDGREWDMYNLSRKTILEQSVSQWLAIRSFQGGYHACSPDPLAEFPEPVFPDYDEHEWLKRSLGVSDLIIGDENHHVFKAIRRL
jgi:hypothetical protein